jgi:thiol-disulfide isomerase/thioredoxin
MKTKLLTIASILLPFILAAQAPKLFTINIKMATGSVTKVYLVYKTDGRQIIDSAIQKNGVYSINGTVMEPLNATLLADQENIGLQAVMKKAKMREDIDAIKFYIHQGTINVKTGKMIANATFPGSAINTDNERLKALLKPINDRLLSLANELYAGGYIVDPANPSANRTMTADDLAKMKRIKKQSDSLKAAEKPIYKKFAQVNPNSYIALLALQNYTPTHPDVNQVKQIIPAFKRLSPTVRNTALGKAFYKSLMDIKNLVAGTKAPDFTQNDTLGKPVSLASFKGKYVLIDFWASWCGPCRTENPALVKIYKDYKDKNFTILGVSLDGRYSKYEKDGKAAWLKAIKDDRLTWTQVSDLKHWDNEVSKLYSIRAVPEKILVDPNGIIVSRGMTADKLRQTLEKLLSTK